MSIMAKLRRRRKHSCWTRSCISSRNELSMSNTLVQELVEEDQAEYQGIFRMLQPDFKLFAKIDQSYNREEGHVATLHNPSQNRIWCILALKSDILWQQF